MITRSSSYHVALVLLLWLAGLGAAAQYGKISVLFDDLMAFYGTTAPVTGLLVSLVGFVGILFGAIAGVVVGAISSRKTLIWGLFGGAAISAVQGFELSYNLFLATRVLEGISHLAIVVAAPTLIAGLSPPAWRGALLTLWGTFFGVALALLVGLGLPFSQAFGPFALFWAHGVYLALFALIFMGVLPRDEETQALNLRQVWVGQFDLYRSPFLAAPAAGWLFYTFTFISLFTLLPGFVDASHRVMIMGAMPLVSIASSLLLGSVMLTRMSAISVVQIGFAASCLCTVALIFLEGHALIILSLSACLGLIQGASFAAVPELAASNADRAKANGGLAQMGNLGNTLGTPVLALMISLSGYASMMVLATVALAAGFTIHMVLARLRAAKDA